MFSVVQLGRLDYASGLRLQQKLVELRKGGQIGDVLLLLEHTPVITLGRNARAANVLASAEQLAARGVELFECDRGGDVTFHGPGQLVGYPILDLRGFERSSQFSVLSSQKDSHQPSAVSRQEARSQVSGARSQESRCQVSAVSSQENHALGLGRKTLGAVDYVRRLEEVLIRTCGDFGIPAKRVAGLTGVWTEQVGHQDDEREGSRGPSTPRSDSLRESPHSAQDDRARPNVKTWNPEAKIAAIGVHISRSVTSHGFALNVSTDLSLFDLIVPCGITSKPVTSMQEELGREVEIHSVAEAVSRNFGAVFGRQMLWVETLDALLGNTVGVPVKAPAELREMRGEDDVFLA